MAPSSRRARSTSAATSAATDTSAFSAIARPPQLWIFATTSSASLARSRKFTATAAPLFASASAIARPMPREAPVTSATRPEWSISKAIALYLP